MEDCRSRYSVFDIECSKEAEGEELREPISGEKKNSESHVPKSMPCASRIQNTDSREQKGGYSGGGPWRRVDSTRCSFASHPCPLNFDVESYQFNDLDLKIAVSRLPQRDQNVLILHLMGHKQRDIAKVSGVTRSMISRRLSMIMDDLKELLVADQWRAKS